MCHPTKAAFGCGRLPPKRHGSHALPSKSMFDWSKRWKLLRVPFKKMRHVGRSTPIQTKLLSCPPFAAPLRSLRSKSLSVAGWLMGLSCILYVALRFLHRKTSPTFVALMAMSGGPSEVCCLTPCSLHYLRWVRTATKANDGIPGSAICMCVCCVYMHD